MIIKMNFSMITFHNCRFNLFSAQKVISSLDLVAIIGPYNDGVGLAAQIEQVPYVCLSEVTLNSRHYTLDLSDNFPVISKAVFDIVKQYSWSKIGVFYDNNKGDLLFCFLLHYTYI